MRKIILGVLTMIASNFPLQAITEPWLLKNVTEYKLSNGLRVIIKENHNAPLVAVGVMYNVGFINEKTNETGITHFIEHMMFRGTQKFPQGYLDKLVKESGGYLNGYTTTSVTYYYEVIPVMYLEKVLEIEADRMVNALNDPNIFEVEKGVILSEINSYENIPTFKLRKKLYPLAFGENHPLARYYSNHQETIKKLSWEQLVSFYKKYYRPDNAVLVIVGDVKTEEVKKIVEKYFGTLKTPEEPLEIEYPKLPERIEHKVEKEEGIAPSSFGENIYLFKRPFSMEDRESVIASFIADVEIVNIDYISGPFEFPLIQTFSGTTPYYIADSINENYIKENLERLKKKFFKEIDTTFDTMEQQAEMLAYISLLLGGVEKYKELLKIYETITAEEVIAFIKKYLTKDNCITGIFNATVTTKLAPEPPKGEEFLKEPIGYPEEVLPEEILAQKREELHNVYTNVKASLDNFLSSVSSITLENGLKVFIRPLQGVNYTQILLYIRAGIFAEQGYKPGVASITHSLVFRGGPFAKIMYELEDLGANINPALDLVSSKLYIKLPQGLEEKAIQMLALAVKNRKFPSYPLFVYKMKEANKIINKKRRWKLEEIALENMWKNLFSEGSALYKYLTATPQQLMDINIQDVIDFYESFYTPYNSCLFVVGNVDVGKMKELVKKEFGDWEGKKKVKETEIPEPKKLEKPIVVVENVPGKKEALLIMGKRSVEFQKPEDYTALFIGTYIIGGGELTSKLMIELREKRGLTYAIGIMPRIYPPYTFLLGYALVSPKKTKEFLKLLVEELKRCIQEGVKEQEVLLAKKFLISSYLFNLETAEKQVSTLEWFAGTLGDLGRLVSSVDRVYKADIKKINELLREYLDPATFVYSFAGSFNTKITYPEE